MKHNARNTFHLFDAQGRRKYLTGDERARFLAAAENRDRETRTFCLVLELLSKVVYGGD